ncbi:MAG: aldo/keto reductase [Candidatus Kaiserbacteria bacterium]|nr:aldo/keto reductase [Candidatus Kaiserbacteria bacterium]
MPSLTLSNGVSIPQLGLGTWKMDDDEAERAVSEALAIGYRHIDTAKLYGNEAGVGRAVRASGIPRTEIFVTTKLWPTDFFSPEAAFHRSLELLGLEYVDLYLIHWPAPIMPKSIWHALEKLYAHEYVRAIGVSNYGVRELDSLFAYAKTKPMVNQVKCSPFDFNKQLLDHCKKNGVVFEAYSPLTRGTHLSDPQLRRIADLHKKTPAQILLRWNIEHGMVTIPKSSNPERMRQNFAIFDFSLSPDEMATLDSL